MKLKIILIFLLLPVLNLALKCYTCGFSDPKDYCPNELVWKIDGCETAAVLGKEEILVCAKTTFMDHRADKERSRRGCEVVTIGQNSSCIQNKEILFDGESIKGSICYCNDESLCNEGVVNKPPWSLMILAAWSAMIYSLQH